LVIFIVATRPAELSGRSKASLLLLVR